MNPKLKKILKKIFRKYGYEIHNIYNRTNPVNSNEDPLNNFLNQTSRKKFKPKTVIDVGVAYGTPQLYSNFPRARHLLIEPLKEWEDVLKQISSEYKAEYVIAAAGAKPGKTVINVTPILSNSSIYQKRVDWSQVDIESRGVPIVTLDNLCMEKKLRGPYLIKIDVQGAELDVLRGSRTILKDAELVIVEVSLFKQYENGPTFYDIMHFMKKAGFVLYDMFEFDYRELDGALIELNIVFAKVDGLFRRESYQCNPESYERSSRKYGLVMNPPLVGLGESHLIAGPGLLGIQGGVYNAGAVINDGEIVLLARGEELPISQLIEYPKKILKSEFTPILLRLNSKTLELTESKIIHTSTLKRDPGRITDTRLFEFRDQIYSNHGSLTGMTKNNYENKIAISKLDYDKDKLIFLGYPQLDFPIKPLEKNWVFFEHKSELYMIYSFSPYVLLKSSNWPKLNFHTVINKSFDGMLQDFREKGTPQMISLSANPIEYDENHLLLLIHKKNHFFDVNYAHWAVLIDKKTLLPEKITSRPIFKGGLSKGMRPSIIYAMSVVPIDNDLVFFLGEGDSHLSYVKVNKKRLDDSFIPLKSIS